MLFCRKCIDHILFDLRSDLEEDSSDKLADTADVVITGPLIFDDLRLQKLMSLLGPLEKGDFLEVIALGIWNWTGSASKVVKPEALSTCNFGSDDGPED